MAALYEDALVYETGSAITSTGALTAYSGAKTGRSPLDKRVVKEKGSEKDVWWGPVNKPMSPQVSAAHPLYLPYTEIFVKRHYAFRCFFFFFFLRVGGPDAVLCMPRQPTRITDFSPTYVIGLSRASSPLSNYLVLGLEN